MDFSENIISYHGTDLETAKKLVSGKIDVLLGGGELGQGFYLTDRLHTAKSWAWHRHKSTNVVKIEVKDQDFFSLSIQILDIETAKQIQQMIKKMGQTRSYQFGCDVVWSPIVGDAMLQLKTRVTHDQYKWESKKAEDLLNSHRVLRSII